MSTFIKEYKILDHHLKLAPFIIIIHNQLKILYNTETLAVAIRSHWLLYIHNIDPLSHIYRWIHLYLYCSYYKDKVNIIVTSSFWNFNHWFTIQFCLANFFLFFCIYTNLVMVHHSCNYIHTSEKNMFLSPSGWCDLKI